MIMSENLQQQKIRLLQMFILVCVIVALPVGLVFAHDIDAVERRLGEAVSESEITLQEAIIMLDALRDSADDDRDDDDDEEDEEEIPFAKLPKPVQKAAKKVAASGKIVEIEREEEDGKVVFEIEVAYGDKEVEFVFAPNGKLISKEVEEEDDDDDDCDKEKKSCDKPRAKKDDFDLEKIGKEIKAAVEAGKITVKQGWEKWNWVKKNELAPRLKAAIEAGKMTKEEVKNIWREIEKAEVGEKLKAAVAKGELTEKQARQKWHEYEKKTDAKPAEKDKHKKPDFDRIKRRIEGAVERGDMTREEANAKYREIKKNHSRKNNTKKQRKDVDAITRAT